MKKGKGERKNGAERKCIPHFCYIFHVTLQSEENQKRNLFSLFLLEVVQPNKNKSSIKISQK